MIKDVIIHKMRYTAGGNENWDLTTMDRQDGWNALERLLGIGQKDTGQAWRIANFLVAWHNADEIGGWDPTDLLERRCVDR